MDEQEYEYYSEENSDSESEIIELTLEEQIDLFIVNHSDYLMNLYEDLKSRFSYFLNKMQFYDYLDLIISLNFNIHIELNAIANETFIKENKNEIDTTYYIFNKYNKCNIIDKDVWINFCYKYT